MNTGTSSKAMEILSIAREEMIKQGTKSSPRWWKSIYKLELERTPYESLNFNSMEMCGMEMVYFCVDKFCQQQGINNPLHVEFREETIIQWLKVQTLQVCDPQLGDICVHCLANSNMIILGFVDKVYGEYFDAIHMTGLCDLFSTREHKIDGFLFFRITL